MESSVEVYNETPAVPARRFVTKKRRSYISNINGM